MKWINFAVIIIIVILLYLYERNKVHSIKEKRVLLFILVAGGTIAGLIIFFPNISGPIKWIEAVFKPLIN